MGQKTGAHILIGVSILGLILLIVGGIMYKVYHTSETHTDLKKAGLGLLISGGLLILCFIPGLIMLSHSKSSKTTKPVDTSADTSPDTPEDSN